MNWNLRRQISTCFTASSLQFQRWQCLTVNAGTLHCLAHHISGTEAVDSIGENLPCFEVTADLAMTTYQQGELADNEHIYMSFKISLCLYWPLSSNKKIDNCCCPSTFLILCGRSLVVHSISEQWRERNYGKWILNLAKLIQYKHTIVHPLSTWIHLHLLY